MGGTTASNSWDEIWAEFDARHPAPLRRPADRSRAAKGEAQRGRTGFLGLAGAVCGALSLLYLASPLASAVQLAAAIREGDAEVLGRQIDWEALRPSLDAALSARARGQEARPIPAFITGMAREMAAQLSEPVVLTAALNAHLPHRGRAHEMLGRVRILGARLWQIELAAPHAPHSSTWLTLALADPWRLRWEVRDITLPSGAGRPPTVRY